MAVKLSNFRQIGEVGQDSFMFEAAGSDTKKYLLLIYPGQGFGFWKPRTFGEVVGLSTAVAAAYENTIPADGFENQDASNPGAVRFPLPPGVMVTQLFGLGDVPASGVRWSPDFLPAVGFTTQGSTTANQGNMPMVIAPMNTGLQPFDFAQMVDKPGEEKKENALTRNASQIAEDPVKWATENPVTAVGILLVLYQMYEYFTAKDKAAKKKTLLGKLLGA